MNTSGDRIFFFCQVLFFNLFFFCFVFVYFILILKIKKIK